ncbi:MAG: hypothetical protein JJU09_11125 [Rhodobacteraceae bacterium]|nr:hypothetical protein [Paracoccaceae bacterium]
MKRVQQGLAVLLAPLALAACLGLPPDLPERQAVPASAAPDLLPIADLLAQRGDGPHTARLTEGDDARAAALRARAQGLRGPVIAPDDRRRMESSEGRLR